MSGTPNSDMFNNLKDEMSRWQESLGFLKARLDVDTAPR
jgi:hypothetical protein